MLKCCPGWRCYWKPGPLPRKTQLLSGLTPTCLYRCRLREQTGEKGKLETCRLHCLRQAAGLFATTPYMPSYSLHPIMAGAQLNNACHTPSPSTVVPGFRVLPGSTMVPSKGERRGRQKPWGDAHRAPHHLQ